MYLKFIFIILFFITSKLMAEDTLQSNFANLKKLLDSKTITIEQFNNGIDKLLTTSEDYKNLIFEGEDLVEKSNIVSDQQSKEITKEIELPLIITQVGQRVPLSLNAKVDSEEILTLLINENKIEEIIINENSNNFFSKDNIKSFKNLKINFNNQQKLKGKGRIAVKSFADVNLVMWWDIDLSNQNPTGEIVIEIPGKGPQIKLEPN